MYTYVERSDIQRRIDGREGQTANSKCQQMIAVATDGQLDRLLFRLFRGKNPLTSKVVVRERQRLRDGIWSFFLLSHR